MTRRRLTLALVSVLALSLLLGAAGSAEAKKKKGKGGGGTVDITNSTPIAIPPANLVPGGSFGYTTSTITVPKSFKGRVVRDVNVTVQLSGTGALPAGQNLTRLVSPNRASSLLFQGLGPGSVYGPLTLDDEAPFILGGGAPINPLTLYSPYQGSAIPIGRELAIMDGQSPVGTWTLQLYDAQGIPPAHTLTLNSWRLQAVTGRPFKTK